MSTSGNNGSSGQQLPTAAAAESSRGDAELDEMWHNLDTFNHSHSGRLTAGPDLEHVLSLLEDSQVKSESEPSESMNSDDHENEDDGFLIPELPSGRTLQLQLLSTWGDPFYVGLNGIEIFTANGQKPSITKAEAMCPASAVPVPECMCVENLFHDFESHDLARLWLTAYDQAQPPRIHIQFDQPQTIAMIRIWNYNKSRVHSSRGVKELQMLLDGQTIFTGDILASVDTDSASETILFTTDTDILDAIRNNDSSMAGLGAAQNDCGEEARARPLPPVSRPSTGDALLLPRSASKSRSSSPVPWNDALAGLGEHMQGNTVQVLLKENHGMNGCIGLTGLHVNLGDGVAAENVQITSDRSPAFLMARLQSNTNLTTDAAEMCLFDTDSDSDPVLITITLPDECEIEGLTVWNYNESLEMSYAGVKTIDVSINGRLVLSGAPVRKAPGHLYYDFVQDISLKPNAPRRLTPPTVAAIKGFVYQVQLMSTWGDDFYIGLNGIEMYDEFGKQMKIDIHNLAAYPESVNVLRHVNNDPRTSAKLIDRCNDTSDAHHMWLAPVMHNDMNRIFIVFDQPTSVSRMRIWNYRKTPERGARDMTVLVDDTMIFSGELPQSQLNSTGYCDIQTLSECF